MDFYKWSSYLASISAVFVFTWEFISPFNFGIIKYFLLVIPLAYFSSYRILLKYPQFFNLILGMISITLGLMIDVLLIIFMSSDILFLAGQTVALVQYSLLIGTNIVASLTILIINSVALLAIESINRNYFKSL